MRKKDEAFVVISGYNFPEAELDEKIEETRSFLEKQRGCRFSGLRAQKYTSMAVLPYSAI